MYGRQERLWEHDEFGQVQAGIEPYLKGESVAETRKISSLQLKTTVLFAVESEIENIEHERENKKETLLIN